MSEWISADFLSRGEMCLQKVRGSKAIRLSGDKANLYKQKKKNRLCELLVIMQKKKQRDSI